MNLMMEMQRKLGLWDSSAIVVGNIIGVGIFMTSGFVATHLRDPFHFLMAWIVGGFLAFAGALTFAELGAAMPHAGGDYVYLKTAYGPLWGFLTGWASFLVTFSGSIAALAVAFAGYVKGGMLTAIGVIFFLTFLNLIGVSWGKWAQNLLTAWGWGL
ncbi:MAG: amino acid permease [Deltaproteobacteria bacterium]|nr:amino acid permease [Deltaproteobacteria bacterium]